MVLFLCLLLVIHGELVLVRAATPTAAFLIRELRDREKEMDGVSMDFRFTLSGTEESKTYDFTGTFRYGGGNYWRMQHNHSASDFFGERSYIRDSYQIAVVKPIDASPSFSSLYVEGEGFRAVQESMHFPALFGVIQTGKNEYKTIWTLLETMSLSVSMERDNDSQNETVVLRGKNSEHEITVWFVQKNRFVPVRILLEYIAPVKNQTKINRNEYLFSNFQMIEGIACPSEITEVIEYFRLFPVIDTTKGTMQYVPLEVYFQHNRYRAGRGPPPPKDIDWSKYRQAATFTRTTEYTLSNIKLKQKFSLEDFAITTPIEEGTMIRAINAPHLPYVWRGGKPVPLYDPTIYNWRDQPFLGGPTSPRFWLTMLGVVLIIAGLSHMVYNVLKKRREVAA